MEQLILDLGGKYAILLIPVLISFFASFAIEAILHYTPEWLKLRYVILIVSVLEGLTCFFSFNKILLNLSDKLWVFSGSITFSIVFYYAFGKQIVQLVLSKIESKIDKETGS